MSEINSVEEFERYQAERRTRWQHIDAVATTGCKVTVSSTPVDARASAGPLYALVALCRAHGLPKPVPEYVFHPTRKWRADYAFTHTNPRVIVEIDGGVWSQGRHTRGAGFIEDQRKLNAAAKLGYLVLRYTPERLGECIEDLRVVFGKVAA